MRVRTLTEADAPKLLEVWNANLPHDQVTLERLRRLTFGDANYEPEGMLVAEEGGKILGLAAVIVRREVTGRDGGGREWEFHRAFMKVFFTVPGEAGEAAAGALLPEAEQFARAAGKRQMTVTEYGGSYLFPGLDVRYERLRALLQAHGYRDVRTIEDVMVDLTDPRHEEQLRAERERMPSDASVAAWDPEMLPRMRRFVEEGNMRVWFPVGWEERYQSPDENTLILSRGEEILGWAQYWPGAPEAGFGPILVLPRARGNHYGALLLLECMIRARDRGARIMTAGWANTGFYVRLGWQISRRYAVLEKEL